MSYVATRDGRRDRSAVRRAPAVPDRIDDLHGHSVGVLEVPHHMACGHASRRRYDLEDPAQLRHAYEQVLCEAAGCGEVEDLINPAMLRRVWRDLHLPSRVRDAWETRHPSLRRTINRSPSAATAEPRPAGGGFARRGRTQPVRTRTARSVPGS
ncbi:hypothetical protein ACWT_3400 [Actinoplanes sp. SE50]|uniref:hypothetical protein n=1 Tax=unclassified Actinoplanes TaxID=2626549 RepID=UPI00023ED424|nr:MULTISPECIES: hypothetical protein [unclassified Actinoplanes]AEV84423.1 hypothetical protein ACPL_3528 [Actinoplanes sp. SE50/110]ATO82815.1 hypothetical protein ACWT_3400 [Actinoplanes sp. SE50]SLM00223.1 hypothetical protein ACSP50_3455 [Actinoplanes sp. SE50/110]